MKLALLGLVVTAAACGPGLGHPPETLPKDKTRDAALAFTKASQAGDVGTIRQMLGPSVVNGGLWFPDPTCESEFAVPGEVGGGRLDELARCLTLVQLRPGSREDSLPDGALLTYAPGFELEAQFTEKPSGTWLSWIGYVARRDTADALPTITPEALEALRTAGAREPAVQGLAPSIATSRRKYAFAWVKVCIDAEGTVTGAHVRQASSTRALDAFVAASADWKFRPFAPKGQPIPVCSLVLLGSPLAPALAHEKIPMPMTGDKPQVAPDDLVRVAGERLIAPDDDDKVRIEKAGNPRLVGSFKVCLDTNGKVTDVHVLRSTGLPTYDNLIIARVSAWRYQPYLDDDVAKPVCTAVNFIYSQR